MASLKLPIYSYTLPKRKLFISLPFNTKIQTMYHTENEILYEFVHQNFHKFSKLTEKEKSLLGFLGAGWRTKDIAANQYTSNENIRKQIKELNKKLELTHTKWNKAAIHAQYAIYFGLFVEPQ